jgi:hypothetical protein
MFREVGRQVSLVTMSCPSLRTAVPIPCLPLDRKDSLKKDVRVSDEGLIEGFLMGDGWIGWRLVKGLTLATAAAAAVELH